MSRAKDALVCRLEAVFAEKKDEFLADLRTGIRDRIKAAGITTCLTVVEKWPSKDEEWTPGYFRYPLVLIQFCRGDTFRGHKLDSALTPRVVDEVTGQFDKLYGSQDEELGKVVLSYLLSDEVLSSQLIEAVLGSATGKFASDKVKAQVHALILEQVRHVLGTGTGKAVMLATGKAVGAALAKPIAAKVALVIVKLVLMNLKAVVAKVMVSVAAKTAVAVAVKKLLVAAIGAAIVKALLAKIGVAALTGPLILVAIGALIAYEAATFPGHLGEKVGKQVADDLSGQYLAINRGILEKLAAEVLDTGWKEAVHELGRNPDVRNGIAELIRNLGGS